MSGSIKTPRATLVRAAMSAFGPKQAWDGAPHMSASGGKADTHSIQCGTGADWQNSGLRGLGWIEKAKEGL